MSSETPKKGPYYSADYYSPCVIFECGHSSEDRKVVFSLYHRVQAGLGVGYCSQCAAKHRQEERVENEQVTALRTIASSLESGLSPLTGDRESLVQAELIRTNTLKRLQPKQLHPSYNKQEIEEAKEILDAVRTELLERTEASWWLEADKRAQLYLPMLLREALSRLRDAQEKGSSRFLEARCEHPKFNYEVGVRRKLLCKKCYEATSQPSPEKESVQSLVKQGLPLLLGDTQLALRAEQTREKLIGEILSAESKRSIHDVPRRIARLALQQTRAKWWVDIPYQYPSRKNAMFSFFENLQAKKFKDEDVTQLALPALEGSEKQIAWASKLREKCAQALAQIIKNELSPIERLRAKMGYSVILTKEKSSWWIDSLSRENHAWHVQELMQGALVEEQL